MSNEMTEEVRKEVCEVYIRHQKARATLMARHPDWKLGDEWMDELAADLVHIDGCIEEDENEQPYKRFYTWIKNLVVWSETVDPKTASDLMGNAFYYVRDMALVQECGFDARRAAKAHAERYEYPLTRKHVRHFKDRVSLHRTLEAYSEVLAKGMPTMGNA